MDGSGPFIAGRIGPNSVIQLGAAMRELGGEDEARRLFEAAGCSELLDHPPEEMIDEAVPIGLFAALWANWPPGFAADRASLLRQGWSRGAGSVAERSRPE